MERMRHQMPKSDTECFVLVCVDSETSAICGTVMTTLHHYDFDTAGRADTDSDRLGSMYQCRAAASDGCS